MGEGLSKTHDLHLNLGSSPPKQWVRPNELNDIDSPFKLDYICLYYEQLPQRRGSLLGDIDVMDNGYTTNLDMKWLTCPPHEDKNGEFTIEYVQKSIGGFNLLVRT